MSGSNGCNRITGRYELKGDAITFSQMAGTQMACIDAAADVERAFHTAVKAATRWRISGDRLEFLDAAGKSVAAFTGRSPTSPKLDGTMWQLVRFQGGDGKTLTPDDGSKYTIQFLSGGQLAARIDCNRGRGTWKSSGENQISFGPLALTRAQCPPGSLHDQIVKQWPNIRSYVVKEAHLFLSLMADGGIYEFQPAKKAKPMRDRPEEIDRAVDFAGCRPSSSPSRVAIQPSSEIAMSMMTLLMSAPATSCLHVERRGSRSTGRGNGASYRRVTWAATASHRPSRRAQMSV